MADGALKLFFVEFMFASLQKRLAVYLAALDGHAGSDKEDENKKLSHNPIIAKMALFGNMSGESVSLSPAGEGKGEGVMIRYKTDKRGGIS
jgi:hypothetical protein